MRRRCAPGSSQNELEMQRFIQLALLLHTKGGDDHTRIKYLDLRFDPLFFHPFGSFIQKVLWVAKDPFSQVDRSSIKGSQFRLQFQWYQTFFGWQISAWNAGRRQTENKIGLFSQSVYTF